MRKYPDSAPIGTVYLRHLLTGQSRIGLDEVLDLDPEEGGRDGDEGALRCIFSDDLKRAVMATEKLELNGVDYARLRRPIAADQSPCQRPGTYQLGFIGCEDSNPADVARELVEYHGPVPKPARLDNRNSLDLSKDEGNRRKRCRRHFRALGFGPNSGPFWWSAAE